MKIKVLLIGLISIVLCLCLTGCGAQEETKVNEEDINKQINSLIDELFTDATDDEEENTVATNTENKTLSSYEYYSDDSQIVFIEDDTYLIFSYSGDEITGYKAIVVLDSVAEANAALAEYNLDPDEDVKKAYVDGNKVVIEYDESVYEDLTVSMIKFAYSYLDEATK